MENRRSLKKLNAGSRPLTRGDSMLNLTPERRRIVAQYGAKPLKIEPSLQYEILSADATIC